RGHLGGLAAAAREAIHLLDASGRDVVLVETVGVGQSEMDVATASDTTVLVLTPESGDAVQSLKAGIMEIADVFVVNKSDLGGAEKTRRLIQDALALAPKQAWEPPVLLASAVKEEGVDRLFEVITRHRAHLQETGELGRRRLQRVKQEVIALVAERARQRAASALEEDATLNARLQGNGAGPVNPYALASEVFARVSRDGGAG
ncbi:MAG TPA: hypothetical protein VET65_01525, partial [Candidatus Limnocylindrales bacterium]|nr:hypothetical protein [Candidatus Limnocylindrales bacterium]